MSQDLNLNPEEQAFEAALAQLRPASPAFDARTILLAARLRRAGRQVWFWRAAAAVLVLAGALWRPMFRVQERIVERTVYVPGPEVKTYVVVGGAAPWDGGDTAESLPRSNYLSLRDRVLTAGIWALPDRTGNGDSPARDESPARTPNSWRPFNREQL